MSKTIETTEQEEFDHPIEIRSAAIKDLSCNYTYEILVGKTKGDVSTRKGAQIIHEDLDKAFKEMDMFLAHIDGAFESWAKNQTPIQDLEADEKLANYSVSGFKISGQEENKSVILIGYKETDFGTISFDTPKIKLESTYLYKEELNDRLLTLINEVEEYMNGKTAPQYEQMSMDFSASSEEADHDFENAKVE
ncbi:hypothetical protein I4P13_15470 [Elizabethkingia meningoseptica]|uniref:hypothetical protein n=1 Tax=Elizabethkingia meningoseptica TaxID=238 RepID=UPI0018C22B6F|nr:hypothetical protein [Elizabethkingia meningoseptica]MBG0512900.1 hypothetical protein [Elizabethkingia meningoseptica]MBG0515167.1 hypothetical protein [Elizabethkingia meningoseptica]